ncbi:6-bladed beta-propeller [Gracilimonas sp.]|uniref:6-bladed beta-propeller n=1 Tax=Gracilimonas sp. TaxID=1974203 RepID=UPI00287114D0|nr:6-bladed beta-propeller [Gracilimonas sp.]
MNKYKCLFLFIFCALLISCSSSPETPVADEELPNEPSLELTEIARVSNINDEIFFTAFRKIMLTSDGHVILNDWRQQALLYFDGEGNFLEKIGREGRGPGEFADLRDLLLAPGDTIHTFDRNNARHQIFAQVDGSWKQVQEYPLEQKFSEELHSFYPEKVYPRDEDSYWALYRNNIGIKDTTTMYHEWMTPVNTDLEPLTEEKRLLGPAEVTLVARTEYSMVSSSHPNSFKTFAEFDSELELLHRAYNRDATIRILDLDGNEQDRIQLPFENVRFDEERKQEHLENLKSNDSYDNAAVSRAEDLYLEHRAYILQFVMDNQKRYWIQIPRQDETTPDWIVVNFDGSLAGSFRVQDQFEGLQSFTLSAVRNNRLYGYAYSENRELFLVIWEVEGL